jgi:hypothetical protein
MGGSVRYFALEKKNEEKWIDPGAGTADAGAPCARAS